MPNNTLVPLTATNRCSLAWTFAGLFMTPKDRFWRISESGPHRKGGPSLGKLSQRIIEHSSSQLVMLVEDGFRYPTKCKPLRTYLEQIRRVFRHGHPHPILCSLSREPRWFPGWHVVQEIVKPSCAQTGAPMTLVRNGWQVRLSLQELGGFSQRLFTALVYTMVYTRDNLQETRARVFLQISP